MTSTFIHPINIFMGIRQQNVTFCLDVSGSMYNTINTVKEHLIQYLLEQSVLAELNLNRLFNLIAFSTEVMPWATNMVMWNKATVNNSLDWIRDLETKTGTNTLDALLTAFSDINCHAVCLVTDDISDQEPYTVLNQVSLVANGRPVHCIYVLNNRDEDRGTTEFLQNLASITKGSLKLVSIDRHGVNKITPVSSFDLATQSQISNLTINANNFKQAFFNTLMTPPLLAVSPMQSANSTIISTMPQMNGSIVTTHIPSGCATLLNYDNAYPKRLVEPSIYKYPSCLPRVHVTNEGRIPSKAIAWSRYRPVKVLYDGHVVGLTTQDPNLPIENDIAYTPDAGSLLINRAVVARSALDGYYYKGKIINQILAHRFMIQFGPNTHGKFRDCFYQDTAIYDIIHYDDTISHPIRNHDKVLALIDGVEKYAPAEVLEGLEKRSSSNEAEKDVANQPLTVRFPNGKTRTLPFNEAVWLPDAMYDRIGFELNLPTTARKYLEEYNDDYPNNSLPGYPTNVRSKQLDCVVMPRMIYDIWPYFVPFYPLYQNILYPAINNAHSPMSMSISTSTLPSVSSMSSIAPNYYRQIRSKPAHVNADCLNRSVVGTTLTPDELDKKIRDQIYNNRHLFKTRMETPREPPFVRSLSSCGQSCKSRESCCEQPLAYSIGRHLSNSDCSHADETPRYRSCQNMIQGVYDDCNSATSCCPEYPKRSKSVSFSQCGSHSSLLSDRCVSDDECCQMVKHQSINTNVTFDKSKKLTNKPSNGKDLHEDRFGNPKVSIGLPDKPFIRPKSVCSSSSQSSILKGTQNHINTREKFLIDNHNRREQGTIEKLLNEKRKQDAREKYHQQLTSQIQNFENQRTDNSFMKGVEKNLARQEISAHHRNRIDSTKIDIEKKEQMKIAHLREQADRRETTRLNNLNQIASKEANRLAFKRNEQQKMNQHYKNMVLSEEAMRQNTVNQVQKFHQQNTYKEAARENRGQRETVLKKSVNDNNLANYQIHFMNAYNQ